VLGELGTHLIISPPPVSPPPFSSSNKKWQEKAELLTRLEGQVKRMKDNFDSKERLLLEDRDKAVEAHKYAPMWSRQSPAPQCTKYILLISIHQNASDVQYISRGNWEAYKEIIQKV